MNVDENLTAENIVSNDVTAIDAVTGDAANMAADVELHSSRLNNRRRTTRQRVDEDVEAARPRRPADAAPDGAAARPSRHQQRLT